MKSVTQQCLFLERHDFDDTGKPLPETQEEIVKHELVIVYLVGHEPLILKNHYGIANKNAMDIIQSIAVAEEKKEFNDSNNAPPLNDIRQCDCHVCMSVTHPPHIDQKAWFNFLFNRKKKQ